MKKAFLAKIMWSPGSKKSSLFCSC